MIHQNYRDLFINHLKVNAKDFDNDYKRAISETDRSNESRLEFYNSSFNSIIKSLKKNKLDHTKNALIIQYSYNCFIKVLQQDNMDASFYVIEQSEFTTQEIGINSTITTQNLPSKIHKKKNSYKRIGSFIKNARKFKTQWTSKFYKKYIVSLFKR